MWQRGHFCAERAQVLQLGGAHFANFKLAFSRQPFGGAELFVNISRQLFVAQMLNPFRAGVELGVERLPGGGGWH